MRVCPDTARPIDTGFHRRAEQTHPLTGTTLAGKYLVGNVIGQGGAGIVFAGQNVALQREVAIKVVRDPKRQGAFERLQREARIVASLQHPNVCGVYDLGWLEHVGPFVVTERLHGATIADRLRADESFGIAPTMHIIEQVLSALHGAHARHIVHRDIKPQNIYLVDRLGCEPLAKILDFGLAKDFTAVDRLNTRPGRLVGTLEYMAPEQLRAAPASGASDLFAVGMVAYEMLCGRHPFAGRSVAEVQARILRDDPDPMTTPRGAALPRPLQDFLRRALAKERDARYRDAHAMQIELRRATLPVLRSEAEPVSSSDTGSTGP